MKSYDRVRLHRALDAVMDSKEPWSKIGRCTYCGKEGTAGCTHASCGGTFSTKVKLGDPNQKPKWRPDPRNDWTPRDKEGFAMDDRYLENPPQGSSVAYRDPWKRETIHGVVAGPVDKKTGQVPVKSDKRGIERVHFSRLEPR